MFPLIDIKIHIFSKTLNTVLKLDCVNLFNYSIAY